MKLLKHGMSTYRAGAAVGPACWPHHDLIVVLAGALHLECGGRPVDLLAHDAILVPPGQPFAGAMGTAGGVIWVQHFSSAAGDLPRGWWSARTCRVLRSVADSEIARALLDRIHGLREERLAAARTLRDALFRALLLEFARIDDRTASPPLARPRFQQAIVWAENHPASARTLGEIARQAGLSKSHFRNLFRQLRGRAAGEWLRERRMAEARRLLASTESTLKEVGAALGFSDAVSFNRSFTRFHGLPPGGYRKRHPRTV